MEVALLIAVFLPMVAVPLLALWGGGLGGRVGWAALVVPVVSFGAVMWMAGERGEAASVVISWPWVPALGLSLSFLVDGLSLFYGGVVSGVGLLIFFYAIHYFGPKGKELNRFFSYLCLFMAAMLGTVFSNNLLSLFVFWELTGIASFLLIGFKHESAESRVGARMALLITLLTGLFMLVGILMVGMSAGTLEIAELMERPFPEGDGVGWWNAAAVLIILGAFGKSAQFPFHFWLPNAMAAPTPVSAYLHSATMVKLGVFLSGRLYPVLSEAAVWTPLLAGIGLGTMLLAYYLAMVSNDLKAILAYSTVGALGGFIGMYGLGPKVGLTFDLVHVFNHVLFKACLFMVVGIVDHATGVRDIRQLGGLGRRLPLAAGCCLVGVLCMGGVPLTTGFIVKELNLMALAELLREGGFWGWYAGSLFAVGTVFKVAFAARLFAVVFLGREREEAVAHFHDPGVAVHGPPLLLALGVLVLGTFPGLMDVVRKALVVPGLHTPSEEYLSLWHGWTAELLVSGVLLGVGLGVFGVLQRYGWERLPQPGWIWLDRVWEPMLYAFNKFTVRVTAVLRGNSPTDYLPIVSTFLVVAVGWFLGGYFLRYGFSRVDAPEDPVFEFNSLRIFSGVLIVLAVAGVLLLRRWTAQLISLSAAGFLITFYYVLYRAPDLAMTQILVEAATLLLILILLGRFPRTAELGEEADWRWTGRQVYSLGVAVASGLMVTLLMMVVLSGQHPSPIGQLFLRDTVPLAEGTNAVNTILVDFRGLDTLGEVAVLLIAILGGVGLLMRYKRTEAERAAGVFGAPGMGAERTMGKEGDS
ncbi:MAG: hydrogen gas-evolving membrane-bound hydrogenase subunit E [Verrucomicrobiia bacterium]